MPDWDADSARLTANLKTILQTARDAARRRDALSSETARSWQAAVMEGLVVPDPHYVGRFRGEPGLETIGVQIGMHRGVAPGDVKAALDDFDRTLAEALEQLDQAIPDGVALTSDTLSAVLDLCGWAHAEWVRIHPFANGNGRTARLWTAIVAMRYGLPPFLRLRPRPAGNAYAAAGEAAMQGDWRPTAALMRIELDQVLGT